MTKGTQIAYVPMHIEEQVRERLVGVDADPLTLTNRIYPREVLEHPDVEFGFVDSLSPDGDVAWCRYWKREFGFGRRRPVGPHDLRSHSCSEGTLIDRIFEYRIVPDAVVIRCLEWIDAQKALTCSGEGSSSHSAPWC